MLAAFFGPILLALTATTRGIAAPPGSCAHRRHPPPRAAEVAYTISRNAEGALGIKVDDKNMVATVTDQPDVRVGDVIVAVDGERLNGRPITQVIQRQDSYDFVVERDEGVSSVEALLRRLAAQASEAPEAVDGEAAAIRASVVGAVRELQASHDARDGLRVAESSIERLEGALEELEAAKLEALAEAEAAREEAAQARLATLEMRAELDKTKESLTAALEEARAASDLSQERQIERQRKDEDDVAAERQRHAQTLLVRRLVSRRQRAPPPRASPRPPSRRAG